MRKTGYIYLFALYLLWIPFKSKSQAIMNESFKGISTCVPGYGFKKMKYVEVFRGNKKNRKYFEGWYFKMVSEDGSSILSVIPGISLSSKGKLKHAFIQLIDGKTARSSYFDYPIEDFSFSNKRFAVKIGNNFFSKDSIQLDIQNDTVSLTGKVYMSNPVSLTPGGKRKRIMGWYRLVPFMQCYHGVVSLNHNLHGSISKDSNHYNFDNGLGYIEKDWGRSMPSDWIWIQSNNFSSEKTSFMLSVANIPWMGKSFTGFLGFILYNGKIKRFGTYTKAKLEIEKLESNVLKITIKDKDFTYSIETSRTNAGILKAPVEGAMDRRIAESIDARLQLKIFDKNSKLIFSDNTSITGLEIVGNIDMLIDKLK